LLAAGLASAIAVTHQASANRLAEEEGETAEIRISMAAPQRSPHASLSYSISLGLSPLQVTSKSSKNILNRTAETGGWHECMWVQGRHVLAANGDVASFSRTSL
jgi:hypothetical protein